MPRNDPAHIEASLRPVCERIVTKASTSQLRKLWREGIPGSMWRDVVGDELKKRAAWWLDEPDENEAYMDDVLEDDCPDEYKDPYYYHPYLTPEEVRDFEEYQYWRDAERNWFGC